MTSSSIGEQFGQHHQNTEPCLPTRQCTLLHLSQRKQASWQ